MKEFDGHPDVAGGRGMGTAVGIGSEFVVTKSGE